MTKKVERSRPGTRATLADVAALSGMSKAAVSMILNDRPGSRLSAEAAGRVRAAAAELDYRPNPAAQSLRLGKTRTIGFISDQVTLTRFASAMISGVLDTAKRHEHTVLIAETGGEPGGISEAFRSMIDRRVDGVLIGLMAARVIDLPDSPSGVPVVMVNGRSTSDHPSVLPDERTAGYAVARALLDAGHRRIGIIGDLPPETTADPRRSATIALRFDGIAHAMTEAGVEPDVARVPRWHPEIGYEHTRRLLGAHPDITALIAANDSIAFGAYQALNELRLRIPDDVSVVSFDDEELAGFQRPGLTTARLPYDEMAMRGMDMLFGDRDLTHELVPMPLIVRESIGPAPSTR